MRRLVRRRQPIAWQRLPGRPVARLFTLFPDPERRWVVELRITRTRRAMHGAMLRLEGHAPPDRAACMGLVKSWHSRATRIPRLRAGAIVARMYLNAQDIRHKPSEIIAHECTHAAMAWARLRGADLNSQPGEELLCYAAGHLMRQVNRCCLAAGVWR